MKDAIMMLFGFRKGGKSYDRSSLSFVLASLASIIAVTFIEVYYLEEGIFHLETGGIAVFILGAIIRTTARLQLGKLFTFNVKIMQDHRLKTDGLYAYIRHPGYTGLILEVLGWVIFFETWLGTIAAALFFLPSLYYRIRVEENTLRQNFGHEYEEYCSKVKALVPGIF